LIPTDEFQRSYAPTVIDVKVESIDDEPEESKPNIDEPSPLETVTVKKQGRQRTSKVPMSVTSIEEENEKLNVKKKDNPSEDDEVAVPKKKRECVKPLEPIAVKQEIASEISLDSSNRRRSNRTKLIDTSIKEEAMEEPSELRRSSRRSCKKSNEPIEIVSKPTSGRGRKRKAVLDETPVASEPIGDDEPSRDEDISMDESGSNIRRSSRVRKAPASFIVASPSTQVSRSIIGFNAVHIR
jgi:hypothetical protein